MPFGESGFDGGGRELLDSFLATFRAYGSPTGAAMFGKHDLGNFETAEFYFSPAAGAFFGDYLVRYWSAVPCKLPSRSEVALLAGEAGSLQLLSTDMD